MTRSHASDLKKLMLIWATRLKCFMLKCVTLKHYQPAENKPGFKCWILLKQLNIVIRNQHSCTSWFVLLLNNCLLFSLLLFLGLGSFPFTTWALRGCSCTLPLPSLPFLSRGGSWCRLGSSACSFCRGFIFFFFVLFFIIFSLLFFLRFYMYNIYAKIIFILLNIKNWQHANLPCNNYKMSRSHSN